LHRFHMAVNRLFTRPEVTDDLLERADTYLDVIQLSKSGTRIQFAALSKKTTHGVKLRLAFFSTKLVKRFHHRAIQIPRPQIRATVLCLFYACRVAKTLVFSMRRPDLLERLRIGKVEAVTQVNHSTQRGGMPYFAATLCAFILSPASRTRRAVFPKVKPVTKPVPWILAGMQGISQRDDFSCNPNVATVVPDDQGMGNHQRNCGFNLPVPVYIPVAARKRKMAFLSAAMRLPVAFN